jgi:hypothetical protein
MHSAALKSFFASIETAREQIPPHADTALSATVQTRILFARVLRSASETLPQAGVGSFERAGAAAVAHS